MAFREQPAFDPDQSPGSRVGAAANRDGAMHTADQYREKAARFRELAEGADERTAATLLLLADDYEAEARRLEPDAEPPNLAT